ncbi:MAG: DUF4044 domain-containing protein [Candidatus Pacebacteria bacterium]|nr:DUF4044 domain-containing protein [Candidatus Paceibacterota bacterium]
MFKSNHKKTVTKVYKVFAVLMAIAMVGFLLVPLLNS